MSRPLVATALVLSVVSPSAVADTLEEVLVTARSIEDTLPLELTRYGHDVETVSADQIAAAGYVDVSAALQYQVPGLFVSPGSGPFDYVDVSLQGSRPGDVLWLVDGVRINNRIFNDTSPDALPANMVERIEVLKGAESLFYGTQGVAGAINIVTRAFSDEPGGNLRAGLDSNDGYHLSGFGRGALGNHKFVAYASKDEGDGYRQFDIYQPSATDRDRSYDVKNVGLKYGYDFGDRAHFDLLWHHTDAMLDNNSAARTKRSYNHRNEDIASAKFAFKANDAVELLVKAYLHDWDTSYANIQNRPGTFEEVVIFPAGTYWGFKDYGGTALAKLTPGGKLEYHLGYDYQNYTARDEVYPIAGETETVNAFFGDIRTAENAFDRLNVAAGVRYNRGSGGKDATVWNVSSRYEISDALYAQGVVGTAFLLPSAEQLYYVGVPGDDEYAGNPDLKPEESRNLNLSIGGEIALASSTLGWRLTGFARDVDNLIDIGTDDPAYPNGRYENVAGTVEVRGAEAAITAPLGDAFRLDASYTWTRSRDEGSDEQRPRTPQRFAKAGLTYTPVGGRLEAGASLYWVGDVYWVLPAFGRQNFGNYTTLNLSTRFYVDEARHHRIGASIENVFDEEYATRLQQVQADDGSGPVKVQRLGVPQTFNLNYTYSF
ncbi:MAG TPA: TonB-dependent receptor [Povalibacter sp.]|uniref:TonB-dependent receptor plug domain-containing protein n=1 Tax=Povalibacter sp. TaxID=1962978 RepID=UPI002B5FBEB4|nr:TonB-dependent receptor [Povalibacter sp.]HMN45254.1 TonB-dependent receptor [Povalibacter sp.]